MSTKQKALSLLNTSVTISSIVGLVVYISLYL